MTLALEIDALLARPTHAPVVYFVRISGADRKLVKIGTTISLSARMAQLQASRADIVLVVPGDRSSERAYHARFSRYRLRHDREWFRVAGDLAAFIAEMYGVPPRAVAARVDRSTGEVAIGLVAGAAHVGLTVDAFRKRRDRSGAVPGEFRVGNQPAWKRSDLDRWAGRSGDPAGVARMSDV